MVLCVDEDSDRVKDGAGEEIFFDDGDKPAKAVREVLRLLEAVEKNRLPRRWRCRRRRRPG